MLARQIATSRPHLIFEFKHFRCELHTQKQDEDNIRYPVDCSPCLGCTNGTPYCRREARFNSGTRYIFSKLLDSWLTDVLFQVGPVAVSTAGRFLILLKEYINLIATTGRDHRRLRNEKEGIHGRRSGRSKYTRKATHQLDRIYQPHGYFRKKLQRAMK